MRTRPLGLAGRRCASCRARADPHRAVCGKCQARARYLRRRTYPDTAEHDR